MPDSRLLMIDRVTGFWPGKGRAGLGVLRERRMYWRQTGILKLIFPGSCSARISWYRGYGSAASVYVIHSGVCSDFQDPVWSLASEHQDISWKYRGCVKQKMKWLR